MGSFKKAKDFFVYLRKLIADTLFPIECLGCGKEGCWLCVDCLSTIRPDKHSLSGESLDRILTFYSYDQELLKKAIHFLKYKFVEDLAEPLGGLIVKNIREMGSRPGKEFIIIGIPLFRKRLIERGFNQAVLLAKIVSRDLGWPMEENALQRVRATVPQVELEEEGRAQNIKNAFAVFDSSKIINKKIILVDDVLTTGATMEECAKTLKLSGAKEVWGVALAKG